MTKENLSLLKLRDQIDTIDDSIQDLLNKRADVVVKVGEEKAKQGSNIKIRPGREADILYRLMKRHKGRFPKRELARIWREIIVATITFEGPFSIAVYYNNDETGYWDLARDQYGGNTPATIHSSARRVLEAVQKGTATVGIVPIPRHDENENWWHLIVSDRPGTPKIIARLPFIGHGNSRSKGLEAFVICNVEHEKVERAHSFIAVESDKEIGFNLINTCLVHAGLTFVFQQIWRNTERPPEWTYLIELSEYLIKTGHKEKLLLTGLKKHGLRLIHLGAYAKPLDESDLMTTTMKNNGAH